MNKVIVYVYVHMCLSINICYNAHLLACLSVCSDHSKLTELWKITSLNMTYREKEVYVCLSGYTFASVHLCLCVCLQRPSVN